MSLVQRHVRGVDPARRSVPHGAVPGARSRLVGGGGTGRAEGLPRAPGRRQGTARLSQSQRTPPGGHLPGDREPGDRLQLARAVSAAPHRPARG